MHQRPTESSQLDCNSINCWLKWPFQISTAHALSYTNSLRMIRWDSTRACWCSYSVFYAWLNCNSVVQWHSDLRLMWCPDSALLSCPSAAHGDHKNVRRNIKGQRWGDTSPTMFMSLSILFLIKANSSPWKAFECSCWFKVSQFRSAKIWLNSQVGFLVNWWQEYRYAYGGFISVQFSNWCSSD